MVLLSHPSAASESHVRHLQVFNVTDAAAVSAASAAMVAPPGGEEDSDPSHYPYCLTAHVSQPDCSPDGRYILCSRRQ